MPSLSLEELAYEKMGIVDEPEAQAWQPDIAGEVDYLIPFDCVARDIQRWILETSIKPQPAIAFAAAMSVLSVVSGRGIQVSGIKGNVMSLCLAESGEGKDWPLKAAQKIIDSVGMGSNVYGDMASGAALVDAVSDSHSALLTIDEAGHYFASINSKGSNQYSREIMPIITKMYTSAADFYIDKKRKDQEARRIVEPNLCVLGMSTERQIIDSLRTSEVADGSLARFMVIFGQNNVAINQKRKSNATVPETIKSRLELIKTGNFMISSTVIEPETLYIQAIDDMMNRFNMQAIELGKQVGDKAMFKPFYYRLGVRSAQMALLLDQCRSVEVLNWCADIAKQSCDIFIKKFCHLAADNDTERFVKIVERAIKESGVDGIAKERFYDKTRQVESGLKKRILHDLMESNKIFIEERHTSKRPATIYYWRK